MHAIHIGKVERFLHGLTSETSPTIVYINQLTSHTVGMAFNNMHMLRHSGACCNMLASI